MRYKKLLLVTLFFGMVNLLSSQKDEFVILYTSTDEGIVYTDAAKEKQPVFSGINLPVEGQLFLEDGTWMNILFNGQKRRLEGPKVFKLEALADQINSKSKPTFLSRFWTFLSNSISRTNTNDQLEEYHQEFMQARAAVEGFANRKYEIQVPSYLGEIIGSSSVVFNWDSIATLKGTYTFRMQSRDEIPVMEVTTKTNRLTIELAELNLKEGVVYEWKVLAIKPNGSYAYSPSVAFSYEPIAAQKYIQRLRDHENMQDLEELEQQLFILHELDRRQFHYNAYQTYKQMLEEDPEDLLMRKLFAAFLTKNNALKEAKSILSKK